MYEFHTVQEGTDIHPGQTADIDYSIARTVRVKDRHAAAARADWLWPVADHRQNRADGQHRRGSAHYKVNALGFASNVVLPARKVSLGLKYFKEFSNRSTFQGYTLQIAGAVTF